jgi:hypothetical protein
MILPPGAAVRLRMVQIPEGWGIEIIVDGELKQRADYPTREIADMAFDYMDAQLMAGGSSVVALN